MASENSLRVAVVGAGAFGRNHLRVYRELQDAGHGVQLVAMVDRDAAVAAKASAEFDVPAFDSIEACLNVVTLNAASVCVPTVHHAAAAAPLLAAGVDLLVEKPLAASLADADSILEAARAHGRIVQAGHLERFNPAVTAARQHLHRPMFFEAHRLSIFTPRSLDVDVVLDLMIHDLDIVLSLVASPVREVRAVGLPVLSNKVDIANVRIEFENGCIANFTASRISTERVRKLRFFQPHQYCSLDYSRQEVFTLSVEPASAAAAPSMFDAGFPSIKLPSGLRIVPSKPQVALEEPLHAELVAFLDAVRNRTRPAVPLEDGRRALALALEILREIEDHARRANLGALSVL